MWLVTFSEALNLSIVGPDYVTVGVPSNVECTAKCPECTFSMSLDGQSAQGQGNALAFTVNSWAEALTVTCTATNEDNGVTETTTKQLRVLGMWLWKTINCFGCHMKAFRITTV